MHRYVALVALLAVSVAAEAPYPASGWRPEGAQFRLPTEYGAPLLLLQPQPRRVEVQISRENVQFAGRQIAQELPAVTTTTTTTTVEPVTQTTPFTTSTTEQAELDPLKVQGLPSEQGRDFQQRANLRQRVVNRPLPANIAQRPLFPVSGQLRALPAVRGNVFQQQVVQQPQAVPAETYGPPEQEEEEQQQPEEQPVTTEQPQAPQDDNDDDYDEDDAGRTVVAVSNSFSGRYYILAPDNTLQRVIYSTMVTDEDRQVNGFSAQLKYSPVDPIRDPVYTYDEQGQLVRIYKK